MTLTTQALGHDGLTYTGKDFRELVASLSGSNGLTLAGGVTRGMKVAAQGSPNTTVSVAEGTAVVNASGAGLFGSYNVWNDAALTSPAFSATGGTTRTDLLIIRVTAGVPALEIVQGVAGSGTPAITGDNYLLLATVVLPPSTTNVTNAMITDSRVFAGRWSQAWGEVASASWTSDTANGSGGALAEAGGGSARATWVAVAGRKYKTTLSAHLYSSVADDLITVVISDTVPNIKRRKDFTNTFTTLAQGFEFSVRETGIAVGSVTRSCFFYPKIGGGIAHIFADAARPATLLVEDIGPASNPD